MKRYHGQAARPIPPTFVKSAAPDVRDRWRLEVATDRRLGARALRVALGLLNFANRSGFTSVGVDRLASDLGMDRRGVERGLAALRARDHIERHEGQGARGRGGITAATVLKVPATVAGTSLEPPVAAARTPGHGGPEVPATVTGQTLLTHITPAPNAPGLKAGSDGAKPPHGSATAGPGGEVLRMLADLEASPRSEPRPVRDAVLSGLRAKFGLRPQRPVSGNENSATAATCGGSELGVLYAK